MRTGRPAPDSRSAGGPGRSAWIRDASEFRAPDAGARWFARPRPPGKLGPSHGGRAEVERRDGRIRACAPPYGSPALPVRAADPRAGEDVPDGDQAVGDDAVPSGRTRGHDVRRARRVDRAPGPPAGATRLQD